MNRLISHLSKDFFLGRHPFFKQAKCWFSVLQKYNFRVIVGGAMLPIRYLRKRAVCTGNLSNMQQKFLRVMMAVLCLTQQAFFRCVGAPWEAFKKWLFPAEYQTCREMPTIARTLVREVLAQEERRKEHGRGMFDECPLDTAKIGHFEWNFTMIIRLPALLDAVDAAKTKLDAARPLPSRTVASLREKLALEWTYHSNAIEGNKLTLPETRDVLEGIMVSGKSNREHFEAINHRYAILYVEDMVARNEDPSEWQVKNIHRLVMKDINDGEAGRYRHENIAITGASTTPPSFLLLPKQMDSLLNWYKGASHLQPIQRAAVLHTRFEEIHPFIDSNGSTGRLLMNLALMREGYAPAIIRNEDRLAYFEALDAGCTTANYDGITELVATAVHRSLDMYLRIFKSTVSEAPDGER